MSAPNARARALELWRNGFERHRRGDLHAAVELYRRSIATCPTGEAHTFLGWAYAHSGDVERAIAECKRAARYEPRHFPYLNLGRVYLAKGDLPQALREFNEALKIHPDDALAEGATRMIRSQMN